MAKGKEIVFGLNAVGVLAVVLLCCCCPPLSWLLVPLPFFLDACQAEPTVKP